jgi:hypothetical protein
MMPTGKSSAARASLGSVQSELTTVYVARGSVQLARHGARLVGYGRKMTDAVSMAVANTDGEMLIAIQAPAGRARRNLVAREDGVRLMRARSPIVLANKPARTIGASQMSRAVNFAVDRAPCLMMLAHDAFAARAAGDFIGSDDLAGSALARPRAVVAESPCAFRSIELAHERMSVADDAAAHDACTQTRRAGGVSAVVASAFVHRAMGPPADLARPRMTVAHGLAVNVACSDTMSPAEVFSANPAGCGADVACDMIVDAHG